MITKEEFVDLIENYQNWNKQLDALSDAFNNALDICSASVFNYAETLFFELLRIYFNDDGEDWIYWWLFERPHNYDEKHQACDENNNPLPTETIEDIWNIVKKYRK